MELCRTLGIKIPIISAPLGGATGPEMTAAVSEAGGFGTILLWSGGAELVRTGVKAVRALTDRGFAVNLNMDFCGKKGTAGVHRPRDFCRFLVLGR